MPDAHLDIYRDALTVLSDDVLRLPLEFCGESGHWCERAITLAWRDPKLQELALLNAEIEVCDVLRGVAKPGLTLSGMSEISVRSMEEQGWVVDGPSAHLDFHSQRFGAIETPCFSSWDRQGTQDDTILRKG